MFFFKCFPLNFWEDQSPAPLLGTKVGHTRATLANFEHTFGGLGGAAQNTSSFHRPVPMAQQNHKTPVYARKTNAPKLYDQRKKNFKRNIFRIRVDQKLTLLTGPGLPIKNINN